MDSSGNFSVTVRNNSSPSTDGFLHTWLVFEPEEYFSFDSANFRGAINCNSAGRFEKREEIAHRRPDEEKKFQISHQQYNKMMEKILKLSEGATYALIPLKENEYNCVVAAREVLNAGGIDFLNDVFTPVGLGSKILGRTTYKEDDSKTMMYGLLPRASGAIVNATGLSLNNGPWGWIAGGAIAAAGGYLLHRMNKPNPKK